MQLILFFIFFWLHQHSMWYLIIAPWSGIEPTPPALETQSLNHWTARDVPLAQPGKLELPSREGGDRCAVTGGSGPADGGRGWSLGQAEEDRKKEQADGQSISGPEGWALRDAAEKGQGGYLLILQLDWGTTDTKKKENHETCLKNASWWVWTWPFTSNAIMAIDVSSTFRNFCGVFFPPQNLYIFSQRSLVVNVTLHLKICGLFSNIFWYWCLA